jgi:hypothetical protein
VVRVHSESFNTASTAGRWARRDEAFQRLPANATTASSSTIRRAAVRRQSDDQNLDPVNELYGCMVAAGILLLALLGRSAADLSFWAVGSQRKR